MQLDEGRAGYDLASQSVTRKVHVERRGHATARQHEHALTEEERLLDVVRDQQHRSRFRRQCVCQPLLQLRARDRVEGAERLVEQ